jgi:mannose-1-phosphate guanylyltransferase
MTHVAMAFEAIEARPGLVVLLGVVPESAETEYGWIEPAAPIAGSGLLRVSRFCEKPPPALAEALFRRRCLWNSFVVVASVPALLGLIRQTASDLDAAFAAIAPALGSRSESATVRGLYRRLPASSFTADLLATTPSRLAVLAVAGVRWSDWGHPARVLSTLAALGLRPDWIDRLTATSA